MNSSDDYYHGNDPANSSREIIDLTKDDTASPDITHISDTEMDVDDDKSNIS